MHPKPVVLMHSTVEARVPLIFKEGIRPASETDPRHTRHEFDRWADEVAESYEIDSFHRHGSVYAYLPGQYPFGLRRGTRVKMDINEEGVWVADMALITDALRFYNYMLTGLENERKKARQTTKSLAFDYYDTAVPLKDYIQDPSRYKFINPEVIIPGGVASEYILGAQD